MSAPAKRSRAKRLSTTQEVQASVSAPPAPALAESRPKRKVIPNVKLQDFAAGPTSLAGVKAPFPLYFNSSVKPLVKEDAHLESIEKKMTKVNHRFIGFYLPWSRTLEQLKGNSHSFIKAKTMLANLSPPQTSSNGCLSYATFTVVASFT